MDQPNAQPVGSYDTCRAAGYGAIPAFLLCCGAVFGCYLFAGNSLDLFFGAILLGVLIVVPYSAFAGHLPGAGVIGLAGCLGVGMGWLIPVFKGIIALTQWLQCMLILSSFMLCVTMLVQCTSKIFRNRPTAIAVVVIATLAWLTFPIWLCTSLIGCQLNGSTLVHPMFAINHVVANLGIWTEQQHAYTLTNLGQDVEYRMPVSAWPVIAVQCGTAMLICSISFACSRIAPRSMNQIDTNANAINNR